jgi:hypothetical protein
MELVEVFKTSVGTPAQARRLEARLRRLFPTCRITFDLADCDNILRIAGAAQCPSQAVACLVAAGYECTRLD